MAKIALIRPERQLEESTKLAESYGYDTIAAPLVSIVPVDDPNWDNFMRDLKADNVDYIIITSVNGVDRCVELGLSADLIQHAQVVAIGPTTKKALLKKGIQVDLIPDDYSSSGILTLMKGALNKNVWMLRSAYGSELLCQGLRVSGANVREVVLYTLVELCGEKQKHFINAIVKGDVSAVLFTSSVTVKSFFECTEALGVERLLLDSLRRCLIASIGKPTTETLERYEIHVDIMPPKATYVDLVAAVDKALKAQSYSEKFPAR
jgi:uroporphyrinogen-III synthase